MLVEQIVFYLFAALVVVAGFLMITVRNTVASALFLVLAFFGSAVLWILLQAEFLALVLVFVYVGAVMTLFLFVVMMLNLNIRYLKGGFVKFLPLAGIIVGAMVALMLLIISPERFGALKPVQEGASYSNIKELGGVLYTHYAYPFELAAVLLLVAIVAAISLCHLEKKRRKIQDIPAQIQAKASERVKIVSMDSERDYLRGENKQS